MTNDEENKKFFKLHSSGKEWSSEEKHNSPSDTLNENQRFSRKYNSPSDTLNENQRFSRKYNSPSDTLNENPEIKVRPIKNGTVIDHINAGVALNVVRILNLDRRHENVVSVLMNAPGSKDKKDVVKIEGKELSLEEVNKISLISPNATINIIRDFKVLEKKQVQVPNSIKGFVRCINPNCISNSNEPIQSKFNVYENNKKIQLMCIYCERVISECIDKYLIT